MLRTELNSDVTLFNQYANVLKVYTTINQIKSDVEHNPIKKICYSNGIPRITWTGDKVHKMNIIKNFQYAIVGKFSYG